MAYRFTPLFATLSMSIKHGADLPVILPPKRCWSHNQSDPSEHIPCTLEVCAFWAWHIYACCKSSKRGCSLVKSEFG
ncbi:hypothetical protein CC77DRAFT_1022097 [Alternaria alternata]|uniref:Uncharacterized protein n=1 Tax=Alternaria alternata TaxID=5599 RepID=A0A177DH66_ALTAL|nr:hypothetical protein CC77DRAFT_1022097 [Alternaria alternata]OAG18540.1 hypothetical protein CC77DRAFT_1022097 [Alternaria alternata]